jgi:hypothetical protein
MECFEGFQLLHFSDHPQWKSNPGPQVQGPDVLADCATSSPKIYSSAHLLKFISSKSIGNLEPHSFGHVVGCALVKVCSRLPRHRTPRPHHRLDNVSSWSRSEIKVRQIRVTVDKRKNTDKIYKFEKCYQIRDGGNRQNKIPNR